MTDILINKVKKVEEYKDEGKEEDESIDDEEINMTNAELANIYDEEIILIDKESSGEDDTEQNKDIFKKTDDKDNKNKIIIIIKVLTKTMIKPKTKKRIYHLMKKINMKKEN